jgi:peptidoglycan/LPS O-acetylase OafA/YrhL
MKRLRGLDGLRGVAVILVVFFHYTYGFARVMHPHSPGLAATFYAGNFGVELFFIISGYVILMTVERSPNLYTFAVGRFSRLYPPFVFAVLFTASVTIFTGFQVGVVQPADVPANFVMITYLLGIKPVDTVYWTLSYECVFYAIIGIGLLALRIRRLELLCIAWLLVAYTCKFVLQLPLPNAPAHVGFSLAVATASDFAYLFVLGMMINRLHQGRQTRLTLPVIGLALLPVVYMTIEALTGHNPGGMRSGLEHAGLVIIFAALVYWAPIRRIPFLQAGPLPWLGDISYSLYLIHQAAGYRLIDTLEQRGINPNLAILLTAAASILVASVMLRTIERPGQRILRRMLVRSSKPSLVAT